MGEREREGGREEEREGGRDSGRERWTERKRERERERREIKTYMYDAYTCKPHPPYRYSKCSIMAIVTVNYWPLPEQWSLHCCTGSLQTSPPGWAVQRQGHWWGRGTQHEGQSWRSQLACRTRCFQLHRHLGSPPLQCSDKNLTDDIH